MSVVLESAVAYDGLPISSGGAQGLGRVGAREAVAAWRGFLATRTEARSIRSWFDLPTTPGLPADPSVAHLIETEFPADASRVGRRAVPSERIEDGLSLFESLEPLPTNRWGMAPVWLWITAEFRLRSPSDPSSLWPGQDPALFGHFQTPGGVTLVASSTRLNLQAKRSIGLSLSIPEATDADLAGVVPWLQAALPFRLSPNHWTRSSLTQSGQSYRGRRITVPIPT